MENDYFVYNFKEHLINDEEILYEGRPVPGKGNKQVWGYLFGIAFIGLMLVLLIWNLSKDTNGLDFKYILFFTICGGFLLLFIWGLIYDLFIKKRAVSDDYYCLTNKRVLKYERKKDRLVFGYLKNYKTIQSEKVKNHFGDVRFEMDLSTQYNSDTITPQELAEIKNMILHPDPNNMPSILFESIENPDHVKILAREARDKILNNVNSQ